MDDKRTLLEKFVDFFSQDGRWNKRRDELRCDCIEPMRESLSEFVTRTLHRRKGPERRLTDDEQRKFYFDVQDVRKSKKVSIETAIALLVGRDGEYGRAGISEETGRRYFYEIQKRLGGTPRRVK